MIADEVRSTGAILAGGIIGPVLAYCTVRLDQ